MPKANVSINSSSNTKNKVSGHIPNKPIKREDSSKPKMPPAAFCMVSAGSSTCRLHSEAIITSKNTCAATRNGRATKLCGHQICTASSNTITGTSKEARPKKPYIRSAIHAPATPLALVTCKVSLDRCDQPGS